MIVSVSGSSISALIVKSRRRTASVSGMNGSPVTTNPRCPRPTFDSRRGSATSMSSDLVDREALADRIDASKGRQDVPQPIGRQPVDFEVDVVRGEAEEPVAHPAADDERATAGVADGAGDGEGLRQEVGWHGHETRLAGTARKLR